MPISLSPQQSADQAPRTAVVSRWAVAALPDEEAATFFSDEGETAQVFGVEPEDVLHIREPPDLQAPASDAAAPTAELTPAGRERTVDSGSWAEVESADGLGRVRTSYLALGLPPRGRGR